ncbi:hypothetical protein [Streptomyces flavofungini]|uniref:hypothetical protein n=1 Tax=Streptomyces flavofungini TaxID=68200 RepID=UPI0034DFBD07
MYGGLGLVALVVVVALAGVLAGQGGDDEPPKRPPANERTASTVSGAAADVEIARCSVSSSSNLPQASLRITNHSSKTSDYWINVEFLDAKGERVAEGATFVNNLAAQQVARDTVTGFTQASGKIVCRITEVTRLAS